MAKCKCKWWPHNWFCLKGLYWTFVTLFYLTLAYTLYEVYLLTASPMIEGTYYWLSLLVVVLSRLGVALLFITIAKVLQALFKIKKVVAPCSCSEKEQVEFKEEAK